MIFKPGVCSHLGQFPVAPLAEQVGHLVQDSPPPLSSLGKVRSIVFPHVVSGF